MHIPTTTTRYGLSRRKEGIVGKVNQVSILVVMPWSLRRPLLLTPPWVARSRPEPAAPRKVTSIADTTFTSLQGDVSVEQARGIPFRASSSIPGYHCKDEDSEQGLVPTIIGSRFRSQSVDSIPASEVSSNNQRNRVKKIKEPQTGSQRTSVMTRSMDFRTTHQLPSGKRSIAYIHIYISI